MAQPHSAVTSEDVRRRTRLILAICLIGIPLEVIDVLTSWSYAGSTGLNPWTSFAISAITFLSVVGTYFVARSRHATYFAGSSPTSGPRGRHSGS